MREESDHHPLFGFDSFLGFREPTGPDSAPDRNTLVPGFFEETVPAAPFTEISVLILDCDLFESYKVCLTHLYPKIQKGGWIVFDEYFSPHYPGARVAVDEFFRDKKEKPTRADHLLQDDPYERWYAVKSGE